MYTVDAAQNVDTYTNGESLATVTDADGAITSAVLANGTTLPTGTSLDPVTGEITVTDASLLVAGSYDIDITTTDANGGTTTQTVTIVFTTDTDGDGINDDIEITNGSNPNDPCDPVQAAGYTGYDASNAIWVAADCDGDGVINGTEDTNGTDPYAVSGDTDGDGINDDNEIANGSNQNDPCDPVQAAGYTGYDASNVIWAAADCDGDGVNNGTEDTNGTDPYDLDTDGDGVTDGQEVSDGTSGTDPCSLIVASQSVAPDAAWNNADCDGDGNPNGSDPNILSPTAVDDNTTADVGIPRTINILTNDDYLPGSVITILGGTAAGSITVDQATGEVTYTAIASELNNTVTIDYQVCNGAVCSTATLNVTIPSCTDTDGDNICDVDDTAPNDPCAPRTNPNWQNQPTNDCDGDGDTVSEDPDDTDPCVYATAPVSGDPVYATWSLLDCDSDGVNNGDEATNGTDPLDEDTDGDGVIDGQEVVDNTSGIDPCSLIVASQSVSPDAAWNNADCDGDGVTNGDEIINGTDPLQVSGDTDGDGINDDNEIANGSNQNDPCDPVQAAGYTGYDASNAIWAAADCDVDGVNNGTEDTNGTDPYNYDDTEAVYVVDAAQNVDTYANGESLATVTDADGAITGAVLANGTTLPAGTSLDPVTGEIIVSDASLLVAGSYDIDITTTDANGGTTTQTITIEFTADTEAVYVVDAAQNVDTYTNGESLATVTDADGAITSAVLANGTTLPPGTSLDPVTGEITVTDASLLVADTYTVDITTTDANGGTTTQTVTITFDPAGATDTEAVYVVDAAQNVDTYTDGESLATVTDADGAIISAVLANGTTLPAGTSLDPVTGEITVTDASLLVADTYTVDITTTDANGGTTTQTVTIEFTADTEAVYVVDAAHNVDMYTNGESLATVTDADGAITSAVLANGTTLPAGTSLDPVTGEITVSDASLLVADTYTVDITTTDANGGTTTQTITIVFTTDIEAVYVVDAAQNVDAYTNGESLATVTDADGAITSAVLANGTTLPAGTSLDPVTGEITVTDASLLVADTYTVDITTTDANGGTTTQTITIVFTTDIEAVYVVDAAQNVDAYTNGESLATVTDADGAITSAVLANGTTLPAGTSLDPVTGEITVTDASLLVADTYTVDITTTDANGGTTTQTITITFDPAVATDTESVYVVDAAHNVDMYTNGESLATVTDADGAIISAELANGTTLPPGTSLDPVTGEITVSDASLLVADTYTVDITTTDANGGTTTQTVTIVFTADIEAVYVVDATPNVDTYTNGESLATVTDADGAITSAVLANGTTLPAGTGLDPVTGEITVSDASLLVADTYTVDITTTDANGGTTTQTITIVFTEDLDTDGDGVRDSHELEDGTDLKDPCDFDQDSRTLAPTEAWNLLDCDGDNVSNGNEDNLDTDNDGTPDYLDIDDDGDGINTIE